MKRELADNTDQAGARPDTQGDPIQRGLSEKAKRRYIAEAWEKAQVDYRQAVETQELGGVPVAASQA